MRLANPAATDRLGARFARALTCHDAGLAVSLVGELGAGKTALTRAIVHALGYEGPVVSPSYTLVEPYPIGNRILHHVDLYRLADPEEFEFLGVRDIDRAHDWLFVEWAVRGAGFLPGMDVVVELRYAENGRVAQIRSCSDTGVHFLGKLGNMT